MLTKSQIQYVKSLRSKKIRQKYNQFVVEGEKAVTELLQTNLAVHEVFGIDDWVMRNLPLLKGVQHAVVTTKELERISGFEQPNKALAVVQMPANTYSPAVLQQPITIALDFIQDPGNMGTIIRTADWYGIRHILCSPNCVDVYSPKVINATMGSFARVAVHYVDLEEVLKTVGERLYACVMDGQSLYTVQAAHQPIVLIGNEGSGVSEHLLQIAKNKISIPRRGGAESLNAAVATAVVVDSLVRIHP